MKVGLFFAPVLLLIGALVSPATTRANNVWYSESVQYWGDVVVNPDQPISVSCKMSAFDPYVWTLNGLPLPVEEDSRLYYRQFKNIANDRVLTVSIIKATEEWSGDYRCNRFSREFHRVTVRPVPGTKPHREHNVTTYNQLLLVGETNTISCPVLTDDSVPVSWYKNGHQVLPKSNIVAEGKQLAILNAQPPDAGQYMCAIASIPNPLENGQLVNLQHKAVVISFKELQDLLVGDSLTLECVAYGSPVPKITWYIGNLELTASQRFASQPIKLTSKKTPGLDDILSIPQVSLSDSNLYTCRAENALGYDETSSFVRVAESSIVTNANKYTRELLFRVGYPLVLACDTSKVNPNWNVMWFKDDVRVETTPPKTQIFDDNNTLVIHDGQETDSGEYICVVHGYKVTKIISATIYARTRRLEASGDDSGGIVEMKHEEPLILQCNSTNRHHDWEVVWYKDYILQTNDHHLALNDYNNSLIIAHPKDEDPGDYMCVVKATKVDRLINATIKVRNKPRIQRYEERSWDLQEGALMDIHCVIKTGLPTPVLTWYKDGVKLPADDVRYILLGDGFFADARLIIEEVVPEDRAVYTCRAENWLGFDEVHLLIRVRATLAPLFPAIGICLEFAALFTILAFDKRNRRKPVHRPVR